MKQVCARVQKMSGAAHVGAKRAKRTFAPMAIVYCASKSLVGTARAHKGGVYTVTTWNTTTMCSECDLVPATARQRAQVALDLSAGMLNMFYNELRFWWTFLRDAKHVSGANEHDDDEQQQQHAVVLTSRSGALFCYDDEKLFQRALTMLSDSVRDRIVAVGATIESIVRSATCDDNDALNKLIDASTSLLDRTIRSLVFRTMTMRPLVADGVACRSTGRMAEMEHVRNRAYAETVAMLRSTTTTTKLKKIYK